MILRFGLYLVFLLIAAFESVVYKNVAVSMIFVTACMIPVISLLFLFIKRSCIRVGINPFQLKTNKKDDIPVRIHISSRRYLSVGKIEFKLTCLSLFSGEKEKNWLTFDDNYEKDMMDAYEITGYTCDKLQIVIDRIRIWDIFHMFYLTKKVNLIREVVILPQIYETEVIVSERVRHFMGETEEDEPEMAGHDYSQIYQIRPYRAGDRLQMIHWKLTARNDEFYVREAGEPICLSVGVFLDFSAISQEEKQRMGALIEAALSISNALLEQKCCHFIAWYDFTGKKLCKNRIVDIEDIEATTEYLMSSTCYFKAVDLKEMYREQFPYGLYAADIMLGLSGNIDVYGELAGSFDWRDMKKSMEECSIRI